MPTLQQNLTLLYEAEFAHPGSARQVDLAAKFNAMFTAEMQSFITYATTTTVPFRERLVWFWSNHFAIMATVPSVQASAGPYFRHVIRPHMTGTIAQMLEAAILHPAMYIGLDAETSFGPQSIQANCTRRTAASNLSINENLGRETLELYSLGVNAGYTQADVDALAYLMTGINQNCKLGTKLGYFWDPSKAPAWQRHPAWQDISLHTSRPEQCIAHAGYQPKNLPSPGQPSWSPTLFPTRHSSRTSRRSITHSRPAAEAFRQRNAAIVGLQNAWIPLQKLRTLWTSWLRCSAPRTFQPSRSAISAALSTAYSRHSANRYGSRSFQTDTRTTLPTGWDQGPCSCGQTSPTGSLQTIQTSARPWRPRRASHRSSPPRRKRS